MKNPRRLSLLFVFCLSGIHSPFIYGSVGRLLGPITGNTITSPQTICSATIPAALVGSTPGGGTGVYTYQWQQSTVSATAGFGNIGGATSQGYSPAALATTHWYRRIVNSVPFADTTLALQITVNPVLAANTITAAQTICSGTTPAVLNGSTPTGGDGVTYNYQWNSSPNNLTWSPVSGATTISYAPPALSSTTYYMRTVSSGGCQSNSASVKIMVTPFITGNSIAVNQSICSGQAPLALTGLNAGGGSGAYTYLWQSSTISSISGYGTASGVSNGVNYAPGALTQTTWFRRVVTSGGCSDSNAIVQITVVSSAPGNPTVFGSGFWDAYVYSDNAFTTYAGYYTFASLSFLSSSYYTVNQSPSSAVGYQGCLVQPTNFSVSFKRTNFTPADYQLDLTGVDDTVYLYVNGVKVYTHLCCINPPVTVNNIWTGFLGATDQAEIRWIQNAGPSIAGVNFTAVTPAPLNPGTVASSQSVCYGQAPANGFTNSVTPTSGCTINGYQWQSSIDSVTWVNIAGATALIYTVPVALTQTTWYRRVTTDACNNSASTNVKVTVNVAPPGNPSVYGNNVWNDYAYSDNAFTTYAGYYTEPSLSFLSTSRYTVNQSPSSASGYQGCLVPTTNFSVSMKRTNFTSAIYQLDLTGVDDNMFLFINGTQVYTHGCCVTPPGPVSNIWTGPLGPTDQVEIRWVQFGGPSDLGVNFTPVTPTPLVAASITPSQTICAGNVPPTPLTQSVAPSGGCTLKGYQWESSTDNGSTWTSISGATGAGYTITNSIYSQTLFHQIVYDVCGNSAASVPDTIYMNNAPPGNPLVFGNNTWNVYCYQDVNYSIYAGYYTEPLLIFNTTNRYPSTSPPSTASGYLGCQLINTYYSVSMKRTGFTTGVYQIDVTADDDFTTTYINGVQVSSLQFPTIQNNIWTGTLGPTDQVEVRWRNNAGPGQTGLRFTVVTPTALNSGSIAANNPNLCPGDLPLTNNVAAASSGCYVNYSWQSSTDGGVTWSTVSGATGLADTATLSPSGNIQYRRVAIDACADTAYTTPVSFVQGGASVGNPSVYGNGTWNVYCYDANGAAFSSALYLGYYTEPLLSFNSANRWNIGTGMPSNASGYQGCQVDHDNHWVSYRRTNFTPGTYQIDVPDHDDDGYLFINGVQVWSQAGCCTANTNVWTGNLGATDQVEFRWRQFYGASIGELTLTLVAPAPTLTPGIVGSSQTICYNSIPAAFTSSSAGVSTCFVSYQWQSATALSGPWISISGATSTTYAGGTPLTVNTNYRRMATDACSDTAFSDTITVNLYSSTLTPGTVASNQTICNGAVPAALTSTGLPVGGDGNYVYQWQSSPDNIVWTNIAGAVSSGYSPPALAVTTYYRRNVSCCSSTLSASSAAVTITVNQPPAITVQPANTVACSGGNTSISVTASGTTLTYQWQVNSGSGFANATNGALYGGVTTSTLSITGATAAMNGYTYRVIITGVCTPAVTSSTVTLTIGTTPTISSQPANMTVCTGGTASYSVTASGSGLTYQWQEKVGAGAFTNISNGGVYSGALTNNLVLSGVPAGMSTNNYKCIINSSCGGTVTSAVASLTVVAAFTNTVAANQTICTGTLPAGLTGSGGATTYLWQSSTVSAGSGFVTAGGVNNGVNYTPTPGTTSTWYQRVASNSGCSSTSNVVAITVNPTAIAISAQPPAQATCAGGNALFSVTASGPGTLSYQWYEFNGSVWTALTDGGIYSGSVTSALSLTGVTVSMNGHLFRVVIFASGCNASSVTSNNATLTTNNSPVITTNNPASVTTCSGNTVNISVTASGIGLSYQWQLNTGSGWNNLSNNITYGNVNGTPLSITGTTTALNGYQYQCLISGSCSPAVTSATTTLTVDGAITNNSISSSQTLCAGTPQPFTVSSPAGGSGSYTYQWQQNTGSGWSNIAGATSSNYPPVPLTVTTQYQRSVSDGICAINTSIPIVMTINPPTSTGNPSNTTVCAGSNASFSVAATGTSLTYQWQVNPASGTFSNISNGSQYSGATAAMMTVTAPPYAFNGYQYRCIVSGNCSPANVTSTAATLTVNPVAAISAQPANASSCSGSNVSFSVTASGTGLSYQWYEKVGAGPFNPTTDGGIYSGSTSSTLTLTGISTAMNNNQYIVVITQTGCPVSSSAASLTVNAQPTLVITNPATVCSPSTVDLTAAAVTAGSNLAGGTLSYWKDAATTVPLTNPSTVAVSATYYIRVGTSPFCYAIAPVVVNVNGVLSNNTISAAQNICTGSAGAVLTGTAPSGGNGVYTYQWQSSPDNSTWSAISGATSPTYNPGVLASSTYYQRIVNSGPCSSSSASIEITVYPYPTATISYAGSPYCATGTASVTQTGQGGGTYSSTAGLSITAATGVVNLAASTAGTYTVTYNFTNGVCSGSTTAGIVINAQPTLVISNPAAVCSPGTVDITASAVTAGSSGGLALSYYTDAAGTLVLGSPNAVAASGTYYIKGTNASSCFVIQPVVVTINPLPVAAISYSGSPYCATGTATVTQTGQGGGTYSSTAGLSITAGTGAINLATSTAGIYTVTYSFTNGTCNNTTTTSVTINALPTAAISYSGSPYCATGTATVVQTGQGGGTYSSTAGLSITAGTGAINLATSTVGTYTVTYSFTNGTCNNTTTTSVTINALPTATISYSGSPYCATGTATVTQTGQAGGTYNSTAGLNITSATGAINLATSTAGTYTVTYSFTNGTCNNTTTTSVTIKALPTATISYSGSPYCATGTASVTQTGQGGGTYSSTAGLSITAASGAINLATSTPGTYTVTYTFTNGTCNNTTTTSVTINALPTATISYSGSPYCATGTATVTQTGQGGGTYSSTAGLSIAAGTGAINLATSTPGTYTVTYSFTNGTCNNTTTTSVTINPLPTATISYSGSPYCAMGTASVTQTGQGGGTYSSTAGLSITAATGAINLATSTPGTYTVTYSFTNGTCNNTTTTSVTIKALPTATISYSGSPYCATGTASVTQTGQGGGTYSSTAGLNITAATGAINLATSTPGTYTVTYSFTNGTCNNTTMTSVTINALPTATISYSGSPYCATGTASVTQTGQGGGIYSSAAGLSITAGTGAINLATSTPGTYTVTYSFTNGTCNNTTTASVTINALPTATISYSGSPYCATGTATVTQTGQAGGTYSSTAGLSITAASGAINLATSTPGTYTVTYTFTNGTCNNTATTSVTINALPTAAISYAGSPYCATGTASVTQTGQGGGTYSSTAGLSITGGTGAINLATSTPGTYTVTYSFTNGTCNNTATTSVTINALPTATISYSGSPYCATGTASVTQTGQGGGIYSSTAGLSITAGTGAINLATSTPGTYTVTYSFGNGVCNNTTTASVTINALPTATISYSGSPYCATGAASVTQTGQGGGTYSSTAGLNITAATGAINLATSSPGTYTVTYSFTNGTCNNTTTTSVTINALPTATVSYSGSPYCATGAATVTQTGQAGGTYSSMAGLNITAATGAINLTTSTPGTYTVTYSFTNGTCSNTTTTSVTINALPTATISYAGSPYCATGTATVTQTGQAGGTYSSTAGLNITAATGAINLATSTAGTYTVTYSFTNGTCNNTTTASVTISALPTATISYSGSPYCATGTASVTQTGQAGGTYSSTAGLNITAATGTINLATSTAGTYTVTYSFTNGTCNNTTTTSVTINALPTATISYSGSPYCATGTATVTQTGQAGGTYSSTAGLNITAATGTIDLVTSTPGTYIVTYSFTNGTCNSTTTTSVTINVLPTAAISYAGSPYCATGTASVTQTGQGGGTYSSTAGLNITAATGAINLVTSSAGTYTVTYSFTNGTCNNTVTTSVTINALPTAAISYAGSPFCATGTATVTQTGQGGGTYSSTAGLSITAGTGAINLATSTVGTYTVTYTFTNGTCNNTATTAVTINALPTAAISYAGSPYCATGTASVTQTGQAGGTYSSTAGVSITAGTGAINLATSTPGTFTVTYSFTNGTCNNTATTSVTINALPTATISYTGSPYCATGTATVTQTGQGGGTYSSTAGLSITAASGAINLATSTPGTYTVTYTFTNGTCNNTTTTPVTINALPTATISYSGSPYCATGTATVIQTGQGGGAYSSTAGLNITAATGVIDLVTSTPGTYTVTYSFTNGTCSNTTSTSATINALPTATIIYSGSPYCTSGTANPTQTGQGGGVYSSTAGLSITPATGAIDLAASTTGTYTVTYGFSNGACSNTTSTTIVIRDPSLIINNPPAVCAPGTVNLTIPAVTTGSDPGLTFSYFTDAAATITLVNPSTVGIPGQYYIQGTNTVTGCTSSIQPAIATINTPPTLTVSGDTSVCKGSADTLIAVSPGSTIEWLNVGAGDTVIVNPMATQQYYAVATNAPGCTDTASLPVGVKAFSVTLAANPDPVPAGTLVTLATSANLAYQVIAWEPEGLFADQVALSQTFTVSDTSHQFSVIARSAQGCLDTASYDLNVDVNTRDFFIPNAFTPNNDGKNDIFKVYGSSIRSIELRIYNQWGQLLYESRDQQQGWDGNWAGHPQPIGVYVYTVRVTFYNDASFTKKGTVNLIR